MPRIRTIKPEFFSDEDLAGCSHAARLLAIGLLQIADSEGRMRWIPAQVQAHVFPWEALDLSPLLHQLCTIDYLRIYKVEGKQYAEIPGFVRHQRLTGKEANQKSKFPPSDQADSERETEGKDPLLPREASRCPGTREQGNKGTREQGITHAYADAYVSEKLSDDENQRPENGQETDLAGPVPSSASTPRCPHHQIIDLYHDILPTNPRVRKDMWNGTRSKNLQARWRERPKAQSVQYWRDLFSYIHSRCPFLIGKAQSQDRDPFFADLGWIVKPANFVKIIERKYEARQ